MFVHTLYHNMHYCMQLYMYIASGYIHAMKKCSMNNVIYIHIVKYTAEYQ